MFFKVLDKALDDWRISQLSQDLEVSYGEAFYLCSRVWCQLYKRGAGLMSPEEVDGAARRKGFAFAMLKAGLADATPEGLRIHGEGEARQYADFVELQKEKANAGVRSRSKSKEGDVRPAPAQPGLSRGSAGAEPLLYLSDPSLSRSGSSKKSVEPVALELADYLARAISTHSPGHKVNPERWARDIDLALRIDGLTPEEIRSVVDYAHRNPDGAFWASNLLSGAKLRKHAARLLITLRKAPRSAVAGGNDGGQVMTADELAAWSLEQMRLERERGER